MNKLEQITNNHAVETIPGHEAVNGYKIAAVIIGIAIALPAFLLGAEIIMALGLKQGALAIICGGLVLTIVSLLTMQVGATSKLSTYAITQFAFGENGAKFINLILSITLFGWYGVTATMFGQACQQALISIFSIHLPLPLLIGIGSFLMLLTALFGFKAIEKLSRLTVPLMLLVLIVSSWSVLNRNDLSEILFIPANTFSPLASFGTAVSAVIGAFMVGSTISADMSRFARSPKDGVLATLLSYGSFSMLILMMAGLPSLMTGEKDLIKNMYQYGLGMPALFIMIFAAWTTNTSNLYSASLGIAQIIPGTKDWLITAVVGCIGTALALLGIMEYFVNFLILLGIAIPPVAGIFLIDFFLIRHRSYHLEQLEKAKKIKPKGFIAWLAAILLASLSAKGLVIFTTVPALDSLLFAAFVYWLLHRDIKQ